MPFIVRNNIHPTSDHIFPLILPALPIHKRWKRRKSVYDAVPLTLTCQFRHQLVEKIFQENMSSFCNGATRLSMHLIL